MKTILPIKFITVNFNCQYFGVLILYILLYTVFNLKSINYTKSSEFFVKGYYDAGTGIV